MRNPKPATTTRVDPLLDIPAVAETLGVSERTVRRMVLDGRIPILRVGRSIRIRAADLTRLINNRDRI